MINTNIGLTSRGDEDEKIRFIADLLHAEEHAVETLKKEPSNREELTKTIDNLREIRQSAVRFWAGENVNPNYWCEVKHLTANSRRADELIENAARINPADVPELIKIANKIDKEKNIAIKNFKSGKTKITDEECFRCESDLGKENYEKLKGLLSETKSLNRSMSNENNNLNDSNKKGGIYMDLKQIGIINGGNFAGKAVTVLADYLDTKYPPTDGSIWKRKGLWLNVGLGILGQVGALYFIKNENLKTVTLVGSSHTLTKVVDYAREAITPAVRMGAPGRLRISPRMPVTAPSRGLIQVD